jgi:hypothetical protein
MSSSDSNRLGGLGLTTLLPPVDRPLVDVTGLVGKRTFLAAGLDRRLDRDLLVRRLRAGELPLAGERPLFLNVDMSIECGGVLLHCT